MLTAEQAHERGRQVFNFRCYYCHGYSGDAKTLATTYLDPSPRNFSTTAPAKLSRAAMLDAVTNGRADTAMQAFKNTISAQEIEWVVDFIRKEFMTDKAVNTRYHTAENGWPDHERYAAAYPFALGELPIDSPIEQLSAEQQAGLRLFMSTCVTCHDRAKVREEGVIWDPRPVSYPREHYDHRQPDAVSEASIYARHDRPPVLDNLSAQEREGERLFGRNCAFCHGGAGTGKNWIGSFLNPHPRDLTDPQVMVGMTWGRLRDAIREGVAGTKMPAWKSVLSEAQIQAIIAYINVAFHPVARD